MKEVFLILGAVAVCGIILAIIGALGLMTVIKAKKEGVPLGMWQSIFYVFLTAIGLGFTTPGLYYFAWFTWGLP